MGDYQRDRKKTKLTGRSGNVTFQQVKNIAKTIEAEGKSESRNFSGTVCSVLGTCLTLGCKVDGKSAKLVTEQVKSGELKL